MFSSQKDEAVSVMSAKTINQIELICGGSQRRVLRRICEGHSITDVVHDHHCIVRDGVGKFQLVLSDVCVTLHTQWCPLLFVLGVSHRCTDGILEY